MLRSSVAAVALIAASSSAAPAFAAGKCSLGRIAEVPITMTGLRPMIPAEIDGHKTNFLLDSGAFYSTISPGTAAEFGLKTRAAPPQLHLTGIGGETNASVATVRLDLAGIVIPRIEFIVGGSEVGGAGLLGQNILSRADIEYDFAGGVVRFFKPSDCGNQPLEYWAPSFSMMPIESVTDARFHTVGTALLNGVKIRIAFDTGASTSILSRDAAARVGVRPGDAGVVAAGQGRGLGKRTVPNWIGQFDSIKLGDEEIKKIRLRFGELSLDDIDMLLGADFFLSHRVYVANSQHRIYFTYNGGPVFNLGMRDSHAAAAPPAAAASSQTGDTHGEPTDAEGFGRRGAARLSARNYDGAIDDLTHAMTLAPGDGRFPYRRAQAHLARHEPALARVDIDLAVKLAPQDVDVRIMHAGSRMGMHEPDIVAADLDAASQAAAPSADQRLALAGLYQRIDRFAPAIAQYDQWLAAHPDDSRKADALNGRCWTRALAGQDLDRALADCNAALKIRSGDPTFLDSRGLVQLRRGDNDRAIADYDAVLKLQPRRAWAIYGRGLARQRKGMKAEGDADIAAATAIDKNLPARFKVLGVAP